MSDLSTITARIPSGTASVTVNLGGALLCGIQCPPTMTSTILTLTGSATYGGRYGALKGTDGTTVATITVAGDAVFALDPVTFAGVGGLKITGNNNETADRDVILLVRPGS